jgi:PAS domain S-box-containing protein
MAVVGQSSYGSLSMTEANVAKFSRTIPRPADGPDALREARQTEKRLRDIIDGVGPSIFVGLLTPDGILLEANQSALNASGLSASDVIGAAFADTFWWTHSRAVQDELRTAIARAARGDASRYDVQVRGADGGLIDIDFSLQPLRDSRGTVVFIVPSGIVITERKRMETALRESNENFELLAANVTDAFWIRSADMRVVHYVSPAFEQIWGVPVDRLHARAGAWVDFIVRDDRERARAAFACLMSDSKSIEVEYRIVRPGGEIRWIRTRGFQVRDADGHLIRLTGIVTDVTQRKLLETQLMVSDRMASMGTLAAGVAHEINNPLAAVIANLEYIADSVTQLVARDPSARTPERAESIADAIIRPLEDARHAAQRVRFIVRDLMIFSRTPNDEARVPMNVESILESSLGMAWNEIRHRGRLTKRYEPVPLVEANEARLGQVFLNLLVNAAQALPEGQAVRNEVSVCIRPEGARVVVEIADNGVGIAPENLGRIFDAFFTTKPVGEGTGLGLAICHRIVTDMGGDLTVTSVPGHGTNFRVSLPIAGASAALVDNASHLVPPIGRRGRILVVDDEEMVLRAITRVLSGEHDIVAILSAKEALARCAAGDTFDVIICDLMMPGMTGMDLHRELTAIAPAQALRMVFLTGGAFTASGHQFLAATSREHMEKPFDRAQLSALVRRHVG